MSVSSLPEWKQLLLERKRREEEEREKREKEEEEKLASMPAWKRGIIQRRRAKQEREGFLLPVDPDGSAAVRPGSDTPLSPGGRDAELGYQERGNEQEADVVKDKEKDKPMNIELKIERFRDRERDRNSRESFKDAAAAAAREREKESLKVKKEEEKDPDPPPGPLFAPLVAGLRTIRADNIIIIEQDSKGGDEKRGRWREAEREGPEEDHHHHQEKRGMKMDLRDFLVSGGGSVTEIRASEVLIIKPLASPVEKSGGGGGGGDGGGRDSIGRHVAWLREKDPVKEKERPRGQATVIKEDRKDGCDDGVLGEKGGRVSQLLSRFGQHPKPPSRSKSSENFIRPDRGKDSGEHKDRKEAPSRACARPKRSVSFSDRVQCTKENGVVSERTHPDKRAADVAEGDGSEKELTSKAKLVLDKDRFGKRRDGHVKANSQTEARAHEREEPTPKSTARNETDVCTSEASTVETVEPVDKRVAETLGDSDSDHGFTVAAVKNTEGISFARRVPIRQDRKARAAERDVAKDERTLERETSIERWREGVRQVETQACDTSPAETTQQDYLVTASVEFIDPGSSSHAAESHYRHASAFAECCSLLCTVADSAGESRGPHLTPNTDHLISKTERIGETIVYNSDGGERDYWGTQAHDARVYSEMCSENPVHNVIPLKPPKSIAGPLEIQIPRTVFYVAEEIVGGQSDDGRDGEGGAGVQRRDSWRVGKPLSRVESLREKIRQREMERVRLLQRGVEGGGVEADCRREDGGSEVESEWEAAAHMRKRQVAVGQEGPAAQTPEAASDVMQEAGVLKTTPQLPVSLALSQARVSGEEVTGEYTTALSDGFQLSGDEDDPPPKHADGQLRRCGEYEGRREEREEEEEEEDELSVEEEEEEYTSPLSPSQSPSPSPPHHNSLAAMNMYNLKAIGARTGFRVRELAPDVPPVHLIKVKPLLSHSQQELCQQEAAGVRQRWGRGKHGDNNNKARSGEDVSGVQSIQRQIEQFQLKEQEGVKLSQDGRCTPPNTPLSDREAKGQQSPRSGVLHKAKDGDLKTGWQNDRQTSAWSPRTSESPTSQSRTVTPRILRSQSPDNSAKLSDWAPTPASSPSSASPPTQSPSVSPSPAPSPPASSTLFSIRSASGGQVKRGATITITPRKPVGGGGAGGGAAANSTPAGPSPPPKTSAHQDQSPASPDAEPAKKRYPTVEEIEVIGGYQNLEKSCLVKSRGTAKKVKVCFDEVQLEQVCEYPSETSMLARSPYPHVLRDERPPEEEELQEEEEEEVSSKGTRSVGTATGRVLKVGQCHPLLKKHKV